MNFLLVKSTCHQQNDKFFIEYATSSRLVLYTLCAYAAARLVSYAVLYTTNISFICANVGNNLRWFHIFSTNVILKFVRIG